MTDQEESAVRIFTQAIRGTPYNAGIPPALANLLVAQAKHETANFTSRFFKTDNNAFGYSYYAGSNYQAGAGGTADNGKAIAHYDTVEDSTKEIVDWIYRRMHDGKFPALETITTPEQYAVSLKNAGYYGDTLSNYLAGLQRFFSPLAAGSTISFLVAASVILFLYRKQIFT